MATGQQKTKKNHLRRFLLILADLFLAAAFLILPQVVVFYAMRLFLGTDLARPFWSAIYSILSYVLALGSVFFWVRYTPSRPFSRKPMTSSKTPRKPTPTKPSTQLKAHTPKPLRSCATALGLSGLPKWADLALAPIGLVVYTFSSTILTGLFSKLPFFNATETQDLGFGTSLYSAGDRVIVFIAIAVVAPIVEEVIFRGWLYGRLRARIPGRASLAISVLVTSVLFGVLHGQWNVGVNVFCLSVVLCLLREITGNLHAGVLLHILKNAIAFFLVYVL